jgi:multiple sugar transport system substrate-binding protein
MEATEAPPTLPPTVDSEDRIVLQWWDYYDLIVVDEALDSAIAQYEAEHPQVDIQRTLVPFADLKSEIVKAAANGTLPDIMLVDNPDHQALAAAGTLADLTGYIKGWPDRTQYFDGPWASTTYQGRNYGVPFESNAMALFYNLDMFAEAGLTEPPQSWMALRDYARKLTTDDRSGFCFATAANEVGTFTFLPFLWQAGGDVPTIGDEASIKALTFWNDLVNVDQSAPEEPLGLGEVYKRFIAGQCAMMINGPWELPNFEVDGVTFNWAVAPWPSDVAAASILGGENFAVGAGTKVDAAWDVIDWMTDPEHLKAPLLAVGLPNRKDMAEDPDWVSNPKVQIFIEQVAIARPRAYGPNYPQISEQIQRMYRSVLDGVQTPEQAAAEAGEIITPLLP